MPPRSLRHLVGPPSATEAEAVRALEGLPADDVLWIGETAPAPYVACPPSTLRRALGSSHAAVVLDLHDGVDPDRIAAAQGFVIAGGRLVLRWDPTPPPSPRLALAPWPAAAVGRRTELRLRASGPDAPLQPRRPSSGNQEQTNLVDRLTSHVEGPPCVVALTARRGRGKSTALALALAALAASGPPRRVLVTAPSATAVAEITSRLPGIRWVDPLEALERDADIVVVDEAAQLSVALLRQLVARHPTAHLLFATTTGGYEGTGRGFVLRFLASLSDDPRPLHRETLVTPIRWDADDPLEAWADERLFLAPRQPPAPPSATGAEVRAVPADRLAADEGLLHDVVGLLAHAHYRTTPADVHRMLDSPNLDVHVAWAHGRLVGATLVAREGGLPAATCEAMAKGTLRIRGHALADTLVCHAAQPDLGTTPLVRSVRIASHPELRRTGTARLMVEHVHASHQPFLFGTLFGATPGLVRFRRAVGYELVRLGASRGSRTGEPSAVMVRPTDAASRARVEALRAQLARDLPLQLRLLHGDGELPLAPELEAELLRGLPAPPPWTGPEALAAVASYVRRERPFEAVASALLHLHEGGHLRLEPAERRLVEARLLATRSWAGLARDLGHPSVREAMRAMRRAVAAAVRPLE